MALNTYTATSSKTGAQLAAAITDIDYGATVKIVIKSKPGVGQDGGAGGGTGGGGGGYGQLNAKTLTNLASCAISIGTDDCQFADEDTNVFKVTNGAAGSAGGGGGDNGTNGDIVADVGNAGGNGGAPGTTGGGGGGGAGTAAGAGVNGSNGAVAAGGAGGADGDAHASGGAGGNATVNGADGTATYRGGGGGAGSTGTGGAAGSGAAVEITYTVAVSGKAGAASVRQTIQRQVTAFGAGVIFLWRQQQKKAFRTCSTCLSSLRRIPSCFRAIRPWRPAT